MKFLIGMVVLALGIYLGAKQGYIKGEWLGRLVGSGASTSGSGLDQVAPINAARAGTPAADR